MDKSVWVSLRSAKSIRNNIEYGLVGYTEEFIGHASLMVPIDKKAMTEDLGWMDVGISHDHCFNYLHGEYSESDKLENPDYEGVHLVLSQNFDNTHDHHEWHLHQDLVINLGLKREEDVWVCPRKGYVKVVKMERDEEGAPINLQIKNQFLKDYLCARNCGLYITSYYSRDEIFSDRSVLSWSEDSKTVKENRDT